jgi:hypothetical protein
MAVAGAAFGVATAVQASIPDASGVIHACYNTSIAHGNPVGGLRVVDTSKPGGNCAAWETPVSWNVKGVTGSAGPRGAQGPTGAKGATGTRGATGTKGPTGSKGATGTRGTTGTRGPTGPDTIDALQGSACIVNGNSSTLHVTVDPATGAVSLTCGVSPQLVFSTDTANCGGTCWGFVNGTGLKPNVAVDIYATSGSGTTSHTLGSTDANGTFSGGPFYSCGFNWHDAYATSTAPNGTTVTSNTVSTPCG